MDASDILEQVADEELNDYKLAEDIPLDSDSGFERADGLGFEEDRQQLYVFKLKGKEEYAIDHVDQQLCSGENRIEETYSLNDLANGVRQRLEEFKE